MWVIIAKLVGTSDKAMPVSISLCSSQRISCLFADRQFAVSFIDMSFSEDESRTPLHCGKYMVPALRTTAVQLMSRSFFKFMKMCAVSRQQRDEASDCHMQP